jgi:hypothetical protein
MSMADKLYKFTVFVNVAPLMLLNNAISLSTEIFKSGNSWNSKDVAAIQR